MQLIGYTIKIGQMRKNKQVFGKCNYSNYHGHNYELIVSVTGKVNPETGYVIDMEN